MQSIAGQWGQHANQVRPVNLRVFHLGLFNIILLALGAMQLAWTIGYFVPHLRGTLADAMFAFGVAHLVMPSLWLGCVAATAAAFSFGPRWRALAVGIAIVNNATLAYFAFVLVGPGEAFLGCMIDGAVASYLALIMAAHAIPRC